MFPCLTTTVVCPTILYVKAFLFFLQQREKSEKISDNMAKIEEYMKKSDSLLYSMIPRSVARKLKSGADPISTCEVILIENTSHHLFYKV